MKPSDIFIGVIDFFSVMLPGALLTFFLSGFYYGNIFGDEMIFPAPEGEAAKWAVFAIVSYIVGNLVFMLASFLDFGYNRFLRVRLFCSNYDLSYKTATQIREKYINSDKKIEELFLVEKLSQSDFDEISEKSNPEIFNTFKWAQHFLLFNKPEALADVQRIVADSKFFRSLVVAFLIIAVLMFVKIKLLLGFVFIALTILCYYRYGELRYKSTEKAYELIITFFHLETEKAKADKEKSKAEVREQLKNEVREEVREEIKNDPGEEKREETKAKITNEQPIALSGLRQSLSQNYADQNLEIISFLAKGVTKPLKTLRFGQSETDGRIFVSDQNELWYCLRGRGVLNAVRGDQKEEIFLIPNQIFPVEKDSKLSLSGSGETIEILVLEK